MGMEVFSSSEKMEAAYPCVPAPLHPQK